MQNVVFVPTSHISEKAIEKIRRVMDEYRPECIAVELDVFRYNALVNRETQKTSKQRFATHDMVTNIMFYLLKFIQRRLGDMVDIMPGSDMLEAIELAKEREIDVALIDMDIRMLMNKFNTISISERLKMILYSFLSSFFIYFPRFTTSNIEDKEKGQKEYFDIKEVPDDVFVSKMLDIFKKKFPETYKLLIKERNIVMARNINELMKRYERLLVVIGAGHLDGLSKILNDQ